MSHSNLFKHKICQKPKPKSKHRPKMDPNTITEHDAHMLNMILKYIERFVVVNGCESEYEPLITKLNNVIPETAKSELNVGATLPFLGSAIYSSAYGISISSLNLRPIRAIVEEIMSKFEGYRTMTLKCLTLSGSSTSASTSSLSECSPAQTFPNGDVTCEEKVGEDFNTEK